MFFVSGVKEEIISGAQSYLVAVCTLIIDRICGIDGFCGWRLGASFLDVALDNV